MKDFSFRFERSDILPFLLLVREIECQDERHYPLMNQFVANNT